MIIDEFGSFLSRISTKNQTGNVAEIPSILQTLWGWPPQVEWEGSIKQGKTVVKVLGPAFSIFGSSTERAFFTALKRKEVASGFVNRILLFNAGRGATERVRPKYHWTQCPVWLLDAFKAIAGKKPALVDNVWRKMDWDEGVEDTWMKSETDIRKLPSVEERELWIRVPEIALRLATVVAVFRDSTVVSAEDYDWGMKIARKSCAQISHGLQVHMLEDYEEADLVEHIREEFRRKTELRWGQIRKYCERKTGDLRKIDRAMHHLISTEEIYPIRGDGGPGRPTERWRWADADRKRK